MRNLGKYFMYIALSHAFVASVITLLITLPNLQMPRIIAGGNAGMWFTVGYILYIVAGVMGNLGFSQLWRLVGEVKGSGRILGYLNFVIYNLGVTGVTYLLMYAGYTAGYMQHVIPVLTGTKPSIEAIHKFLVAFPEPIGFFVIVAVIGAVVGIISLTMFLRGAD